MAAAAVVALTAAAAASVVLASTVADLAASTVARVPPTRIAVANGEGPELAADTEEWAENRHRHAIPAPPGVRRHWVALRPRRDGIRLDDPAAIAALLLLMKRRGPTVNGTPLIAPTDLLGLRWQRTAASAEMASSPTAAPSVAAEHSAAGAAVGAIPVTDLAGDAGPADGALAMVGELAGIPIGRCIRILTGTTCRGMILTATMLRPTTFILTRLRTTAEYHSGFFQARSGGRMQPTAHAVDISGKRSSPRGATEKVPRTPIISLPESPPGAGDRVRPAQEFFQCRQCGSIR